MKKQTLFAALIALGAMTSCCNSTDYKYEALYEDLPFEMPRVTAPEFPDRTLSIADCGAVGNGAELCTEAFAKAIDSLSAMGGGKVLVPAGIWYTGPIELKSNINLHLAEDAVILFSPDQSLYKIIDTSYEGLDAKRCQSPISAFNQTNVAITGKGAIDGNGHHWRALKKAKVTEKYWKEATANKNGRFLEHDYFWPTYGGYKGDSLNRVAKFTDVLKTEEDWNSIKGFLRPVMIHIVSCKNVWLQGVIFQNSPAWNVHPLMCENVLVEDVVIRNPSFAQNGDGIDLESCKNALIVNSTFDVGDDGICMKSGKDEDGRRRAMACENVIIDGCTVYSGHGGFVIGSEMSGGVKNVKVSRCKFLGTDVGLRFKSTRGRGGVVENIWINNITMMNIIADPVIFNLYYGGRSAVEVMENGEKVPAAVEPMPVDETTPAFRDIHIKDVVCTNSNRALYFNGIPEMPIKNVTLENVHLTSKKGAEFLYSEDITLKNVVIKNKEGKDLATYYSKNINVVE